MRQLLHLFLLPGRKSQHNTLLNISYLSQSSFSSFLFASRKNGTSCPKRNKKDPGKQILHVFLRQLAD